MKTTNSRAWLALTCAFLLSACGGGGGDTAFASTSSTQIASATKVATVKAVTLSGPSSGVINVASTNFRVGANRAVGTSIVVIPNSGSGGGRFTPASVTLTTAAATATFTYTPTTAGAKAMSVTNNQGLTNPASITYTATASKPNPTATAVTLSGPSSGVINVASTNFTAGANGPVGTSIVVTPNSGSGGGTFTPTTVTLTTAAPTATFAYTPTTTGVKAIGVTNSQGLTNPASITYTATDSASATNPTFTNVASGKGADGATQQSTTSVTLAANRLALLSVVNVVNVPNIPTVAGWTLVDTHAIGGINRVSVFRRMSASDSTQSYQINFGGQAQYFNRWSIDQSSANVNTSGTNGSGAIVQVKHGGAVGLNAGQNCLLTFDSAFSSTANSTFAAFGASAFNATPTVGSGFTELSRAGVEPWGDRALFVQYKPAADTTADMSWSATYDVWTGVAVEIAAGN